MRWLTSLSTKAKAITAILVLLFMVTGAVLPHIPKPAMARDLEQLQQTVQTLANDGIQRSINQKEAEIRSIKTMYRYNIPPEVQPQIDMLNSEIKTLQVRLK